MIPYGTNIRGLWMMKTPRRQSPAEKWTDEHHITTDNQPPYWVGYGRR
jgi:hypothetical protein